MDTLIIIAIAGIAFLILITLTAMELKEIAAMHKAKKANSAP